ncbi:hypothetical protein E4O80_12365, partial [Neisseria meningitidis]|nr:hypothetical protein [Neisseria meningitidis]
MRLSLYGCFYFTFSFVWAWFEEAGGYRFLLVVLKIVKLTLSALCNVFDHRYFVAIPVYYKARLVSSLC